jgi:tetratricopeptide (TPR) repeat protein
MKHSVYKYFRICVLSGLFLLTQGIPAFADTHAQDFLDGIKQYDAREYGKAAALFEKLAASGIHNGKLYYNLANAYLKQGKLGKAILWYERAQRLIPGDPDLAFNMNYARSLLKDEPGTLSSPLLQVIFFWKDLLPTAIWQWAGIIAGIIFWCLLAGDYYFKKRILRPFIYCFLGLALLSSGTALYLSNASTFHPRAVVLDKVVSVRSGFFSETTELFVLHEGTLVAVEKQKDGYLKIRYAKDKIGWVSNTKVEII